MRKVMLAVMPEECLTPCLKLSLQSCLRPRVKPCLKSCFKPCLIVMLDSDACHPPRHHKLNRGYRGLLSTGALILDWEFFFTYRNKTDIQAKSAAPLTLLRSSPRASLRSPRHGSSSSSSSGSSTVTLRPSRDSATVTATTTTTNTTVGREGTRGLVTRNTNSNNYTINTIGLHFCILYLVRNGRKGRSRRENAKNMTHTPNKKGLNQTRRD